MLMLAAAACGGRTSGTVAPPPQNRPAPRPALRITYELDGGGGSAAAARAAAVMQRRFDRLAVYGIAGVAARADGARVVVDVPELADDAVARVREVAARTGRLGAHAIDDGSDAMRRIADTVAALPFARQMAVRADVDYWEEPSGGNAHADPYLLADDRLEEVAEAEARAIGCWRDDEGSIEGAVRCSVLGRRVLARYLELVTRDARLVLPDDHVILYERISPTTWRTYYAERADALAGGRIVDARPAIDFDGAQVVIRLDAAGARGFADFTAAHVGDKFALVLDDLVVGAPIIVSTVAGGSMSVPVANARQAEDLAIILGAGPLPAPVIEVANERRASALLQ